MTVRRLALLAVLAACDRLPEPSLEGEHVRIGASPGLEPCAGNLAHMDLFVARLAAEMGVTAPTGDDRFTFYWLTPDDFVDLSPCPREVTACTVFDTIYSNAAMLDHELVHLFAHDTSAFFAEGFAVAYEGLGGGVHDERATRITRRDVWPSLLSVLWIGVDYDDAGAFVAYLLDRHGLAEFQAALPHFPLLASRAGIDRVFRDRFGVSLADSVAEFTAERERCPHLAYDRKLMECDAPRIAWDGRRYAEYRRLAADEPDAIGPFGRDGLLVLRSIDIPEDGTYELEIVVDPRVTDGVVFFRPTVSVVGCGGCDDEPVVHETDQARRVELRAGRHSLRLHGSTRVDTRVAWSITRVDDPTPR
ncbi:hypothetical protein SAMN02745121_00200 [Nannocystis exedens]|uniref:Uncharacterized protein n=1 Tax=Nannocystis exedens TaxID=54 RepID=A0A1I1T050_9BACT|nr:hypothetical protein [Nannocystis exedens]PCC75660.1 hypothetical protein NAEX_08772 [Nannocystis exedens]SFD48680.1 hypothetical protein SAMN02745121_00200 [Nannocystis exedens]